jgi:hypothetical protein
MVVTNFIHPRHGSCRRVTIDEVREFVVGVHLGKSVDSTVIAVVEYQCVGTGKFDVSPSEVQNRITVTKERCREHYDLRKLQRVKLQTSYDQIIQHIVGLMNTKPLWGAELVIDDSRVGRPTGDMIEAQTHLRPIRITTTGGEQANKISPRRWRVPKLSLCSFFLGSSPRTEFVSHTISRISKCCAARYKHFCAATGPLVEVPLAQPPASTMIRSAQSV